MEVAVEGL